MGGWGKKVKPKGVNNEAQISKRGSPEKPVKRPPKGDWEKDRTPEGGAAHHDGIQGWMRKKVRTKTKPKWIHVSTA